MWIDHCPQVEVPVGFLINMTVDEFYMEYAGHECIYDWVEFWDIGLQDEGNHTDRYFGKFCGRLPRFTIYGKGRKLKITAETDQSVGKSGFRYGPTHNGWKRVFII